MCPLYGGRLWFKCSWGTWKKCPLYGVSALERFCYKGFFKNSSGTKFFVRLRGVYALEDVRFREVPLYWETYFMLKPALKSIQNVSLYTIRWPEDWSNYNGIYQQLKFKRSAKFSFWFVKLCPFQLGAKVLGYCSLSTFFTIIKAILKVTI